MYQMMNYSISKFCTKNFSFYREIWNKNIWISNLIFSRN